MVNYVSPGVYTIEKDISDYSPSINTSIVGMVGFAGKGPTNKATLITNQSNLIRTFGEPSENIPGQALEGSLEILEQTSQLYFIRAATDAAADASATMSIGTCPSVIVSGTGSINGEGWGVLSSLTLRIQVWDNDGNAKFTENAGVGKDFSIPAGTGASGQAEALRKIVGGVLDADRVGVFDNDDAALATSGAIVGAYAGSGAYMSVSACSSTTFDDQKGAFILFPTMASATVGTGYGASGNNAQDGGDVAHSYGWSSVKAWGSTLSGESINYLVESLHPGAGYNGGTKSDGGTSGNSVTVGALGNQNFNVIINDNGIAEETFKCSLVGSGTFIEEVINTGETNTTSEVIKGNIQFNQADATATGLTAFGGKTSTLAGGTGFNMTFKYTNPMPDGTTTTFTTLPGADSSDLPDGARWNKLVQNSANNLAGGSNGTGSDSDNATALIGSNTVEPKTGMQSLDEDELNVGIALVPGIANQSVQNNLITLAETTQNFIALVAPPYAIGSVQDAIDWSNGKSSSTAGSRTAAINSSYAAIYWPWLKVFSVFDSKDRWFDPSIYGARQMAYTDSVADSWFAPAGFRRGRLSKPVETEVKLNQGDRDSMYSGGNVVNPIVAFPQQGITIWGQRTTQRSPTALDRINIRRLMIYIRKIILASTRRFVFEPNDAFTWSQIEGVLNPFLDDIRKRRGITEFRVVCDETTNTSVRIDRNELWCKVLVKPTKTAEILIFEINLTNQSAQLGNL